MVQHTENIQDAEGSNGKIIIACGIVGWDGCCHGYGSGCDRDVLREKLIGVRLGLLAVHTGGSGGGD